MYQGYIYKLTPILYYNMFNKKRFMCNTVKEVLFFPKLRALIIAPIALEIFPLICTRCVLSNLVYHLLLPEEFCFSHSIYYSTLRHMAHLCIPCKMFSQYLMLICSLLAILQFLSVLNWFFCSISFKLFPFRNKLESSANYIGMV